MNEISSPRKTGVWLFLLIAFGWSWAVAGIAYQQGGASLALGLAIVYMAGPGVAAFVCALIYDRDRFFASLGLARNPFNFWLFIAFLAPVVITAAAWCFTVYIGGQEALALADAYAREFEKAGVDVETLPLPPEQIAIIQLAAAPFIAGIVNTIIMMLTEEVGWRGWLWDRWQGLGFWRHVLLTGFIWGVWHAPLIAMGHNYPGMPVWGPVIFIGWTMLLTPVIALIRERGGSMVHAAMFHGVLNGVAPITILILADPSMPWRGVVGLGGFAALTAATALVFLYTFVSPRR